MKKIYVYSLIFLAIIIYIIFVYFCIIAIIDSTKVIVNYTRNFG